MSAPLTLTEVASPALPGALVELDRWLHLSIGAGTFQPGLCNTLLTDVAVQDLGEGSLVYRMAAGAHRIHAFGTDAQIHTYGRSGLTAVAIDPMKTTTTRMPSGSLHVQAPFLMATGASYCHSLLVQADVDGVPAALLLPRSAITRIVRPPMRGLVTGDNCFVDIDIEVEDDAILGGSADAQTVIEWPYMQGLTLGALYLGGARRAWSSISALDVPLTQRHRLGEVYAEVLALEAIVGGVADSAPNAATPSRAAKAFGASVCSHVVDIYRRLSGSKAYALAHEVNALDADLEGLRHQAPGHDGALDYLARVSTTSPYQKEIS